MPASWASSQLIGQPNSGQRWSGSVITWVFPALVSGMNSRGEAVSFGKMTGAQ